MADSHKVPEVSPPDYLQEDLRDLLHPSHPRLVVITHRSWMEPYHAVEEGELSSRLITARHHYHALVLWLRLIRLFQSAFTRSYEWSDEATREERQSIVFRLDLLGLAGGNSKLALDTMMAGYYSGCMSLERHMLETWRRVAYSRLSVEDVWRWYPQYMWPEDVTPKPDGDMPTKQPSAKQIWIRIQERGTERDKELLRKVYDGFEILTDHAHPTIEGATQTWDQDNPGRRVFGPTFSDLNSRRCLTWGLSTSAMLLEEIALIESIDGEWLSELSSIGEQLADWLRAHQN